jgi:hypothetical protein
MVEILMLLVEPEFAFLQIKIKRRFMDTVELHEPSFRKGPERFYPINVSLSLGEFVVSMVDTVMLLVPEVNQTAVTTPRVRMDYAIRIDPAANDGKQCFPGAVRNDLWVNVSASLKDFENRCLSVGSAASLSLNTSGSEVGFVDLDFASERG